MIQNMTILIKNIRFLTFKRNIQIPTKEVMKLYQFQHRIKNLKNVSAYKGNYSLQGTPLQ